jgi:hypothetical protein
MVASRKNLPLKLRQIEKLNSFVEFEFEFGF